MWCSCSRFSIALPILTVIAVGYVFLGGYLFSVVPADDHGSNAQQKSLLLHVESAKNETAQYIMDVVDMTVQMQPYDWEIIRSSVRQNLDELSAKIVSSLEKNANVPSKMHRNLSFTESLFFSFSVLTTIGE